MITGSSLLGDAVTYRSRLIQFSKQIYATVVSKVLLHNHNLSDISEFDVITAFRLQPIYGYLYRNFNLGLFKLRVNDTMKKQLSS